MYSILNKVGKSSNFPTKGSNQSYKEYHFEKSNLNPLKQSRISIRMPKALETQKYRLGSRGFHLEKLRLSGNMLAIPMYHMACHLKLRLDIL